MGLLSWVVYYCKLTTVSINMISVTLKLKKKTEVKYVYLYPFYTAGMCSKHLQ